MLSKAKTLQAVLEMQKLFPDAHCELDHETPFQLLIATILSAQATDKGVNKVTPKLFAIYPNAHALANSEEEVVIECIQSLGLYRNKAKNIRLCAQQLVERFNGEVIGGSERETDYDKLLDRIKSNGLNPDDYAFYLDLRKYGSVPHSGFGLGLERMVTFVAGTKHIREAIPFPRLLNRIYP